KFRLSSTNQVLGTAVFSRTDVWEFGAKPGSGLGFGPAWVLRFNGSTWRQVTVPGTPVDVSPAAASDIWALGPSAATVNNNPQVIIAMHWNRRSWRSISLPGAGAGRGARRGRGRHPRTGPSRRRGGGDPCRSPRWRVPATTGALAAALERVGLDEGATRRHAQLLAGPGQRRQRRPVADRVQ